MEALSYRMLDESLHEHRQAFLNFAVQAEKPAGKGKTRPVYRTFRQFFDYKNELKNLKQKRTGQRKDNYESRFSGIGKIMRKGVRLNG